MCVGGGLRFFFCTRRYWKQCRCFLASRSDCFVWKCKVCSILEPRAATLLRPGLHSSRAQSSPTGPSLWRLRYYGFLTIENKHRGGIWDQAYLLPGVAHQTCLWKLVETRSRVLLWFRHMRYSYYGCCWSSSVQKLRPHSIYAIASTRRVRVYADQMYGVYVIRKYILMLWPGYFFFVLCIVCCGTADLHALSQ